MKQKNFLHPFWMFASLMAVSTAFMACSVKDDPVVQAPNNWGDCIKVSNVAFKTQSAYGQDFVFRPFGADSLLTGIETLEFDVAVDESSYSLRKTLEIPENSLVKNTMTDMYGEVQAESQKDLTAKFKLYQVVNKISAHNAITFDMHRGGKYECLLNIESLNFKETKTVVIYGAPGIDVSGLDTNTSGQDVNLEVECNTGYPYDYSSLLGNEYAKLTIYKVNEDKTETEILSNEVELPFKKANKPLVAQIEKFSVTMKKPDAGTYRLHLESNWKVLKERDITFKIEESSNNQ